MDLALSKARTIAKKKKVLCILSQRFHLPGLGKGLSFVGLEKVLAFSEL